MLGTTSHRHGLQISQTGISSWWVNTFRQFGYGLGELDQVAHLFRRNKAPECDVKWDILASVRAGLYSAELLLRQGWPALLGSAWRQPCGRRRKRCGALLPMVSDTRGEGGDQSQRPPAGDHRAGCNTPAVADRDGRNSHSSRGRTTVRHRPQRGHLKRVPEDHHSLRSASVYPPPALPQAERRGGRDGSSGPQREEIATRQ